MTGRRPPLRRLAVLLGWTSLCWTSLCWTLLPIPPAVSAEEAWEASQIESLQAFARLYGHVRFFHPSEAVSAVDGDKLAVYGAARALNARDPEQLAALLAELFLPLAPTLQLYSADDLAPDPTADWPRPGEAGLLVVAWQHRGFGLGEVDLYHSARVFRPRDALLFDAFPAPGEVVDRDLGAGLRAVMPLALFTDGRRTFGGRRPDSTRLDEELAQLDLGAMDANNVGLRLGAVIVAWNVLRHFYPYPVDADWDEALARSLEDALAAPDEGAFYHVLQRLAARLDDGQADLRHAGLDAGRAGLPLAVDWLEDRVVVTASEVDGVARGDVVRRLDRVPAEEVLRDAEELVSGSPQRRRVRALAAFGDGAAGTTARLALERGGETFEADVRRDRRQPIAVPGRPAVDVLAGGVRYVDLRRVDAGRIRGLLPELAAAPGVIFDVRGEAVAGSHEVLRHLIAEPVQSAPWSVPGVTRPDGEQVTFVDLKRWRLEPRQPRLGGRVVFLADARAAGYAESLLGVVEHYRLAEIVGRATAGADGTVNHVTLPGGFRLAWTGTRVLRHDGSRFHGLGVRPTVPAAGTVAGVRAGKDEDIEKALEIIGI